MIRGSFRPWGGLEWMLNSLSIRRWALVGAASTEDRCSSVLEILQDRAAVGQKLIYRIQDAESRYSPEVERKTDVNQARFKRLGVADNEIQSRRLLGPHGIVGEDISKFFKLQTEQSLIIDISCLPKKIFFLLIRKALEQPNTLQNILITYTEPETYCDAPLAENPQAWNPLPGFLPPMHEPSNKVLVIGLGYEPLGLPDHYSSGLFSDARIRLLFPFPAQPASVSRNWDFARLLEPVPGNTSTSIERIDSLNVSDTFDKLISVTDAGNLYSILAPFGPKPLSLAMCHFASAYSTKLNRPSVFYTQPTIYNPNYSAGVKLKNGVPSIHAYCIRLNGNNLYEPA